MPRATTRILIEIAELRAEMRSETRGLSARIDGMSERIDGVNGRLDTVIDSLADLRRDFDRHTHE